MKKGTKDIISALKDIWLPIYLAHSDIRQRYRRSSLGPFWITISTGVMIACIGLIFGKLFKSPIQDFLPFLAAGLIIWGFISTTVTEATTVFISAESIIRQLPIPIFSHVIRMVARNFYIFLHNIVIFPLVLLIVQRPLNFNGLFFIPGIVVLTLNLLWISLLIGIICTRYRDLGQVVGSLLQIAFYVTPIIWLPNLLPEKTGMMVLDPNPFYHLIEIVRAPLMGFSPSILNWLVACSLFIFGTFLTVLVFNKYRSRIAYWL